MVHYLENIIPLEDCEKITQLVMDLMCNRPDMVEYSAYSAPNSTGILTDSIPECNIWLYMLKEKIEEIVGFEVDVVNTYCREYVNSCSLPIHIDRADIGITLTVCIENPTNLEWPICSKDYDGSTICKDIKVGDGLLIHNSRELEHWRDELVCREDEYIFMMFLHWIKKEEK
jgi:hypothetical protein